MKKLTQFILVLTCCISLTACESMTNQDVGTITGGVAGGLLGSTVSQGGGQLVAIAAGSMVGAYMGGKIGHNMDVNDRRQVTKTLESNRVGQPAYWRNQKTGAQYKVVPVKNVKIQGNPYCREYKTTADIAGKQQQVYGTACRQPDGSWKVVK